MELALGTAQFGLRYGIAGRGEVVPEAEVRTILGRAAALGIRLLDTASAYGDIEGRLPDLGCGGAWRVVTKLPALPKDLDPSESEGWATRSLDAARERLGGLLHGVLFHRAEDLLEPPADRLWHAAAAWAEQSGCKLGVSCYDPDTLHRVARRYPLRLAQLPGNALDQRLRASRSFPGDIEIHVRSAFLQGLLLMPEKDAVMRIPAAAGSLGRWHTWRAEHGLEPLTAALGIVKGLPGVSHCIVGVDHAEQLDQIATAWESTPALSADMLAVLDPRVIDPRRWPQSH